MAPLPERQFRVKSPKTDEVFALPYANARDLVRNAGYSFVQDDKAVVKTAQADATQKSFIEGNDPTKIDVDALQKHYEAETKPVTVDDMTRDELIAYAETQDIKIDKRMSRDKLVTEIKAATAAAQAETDEADTGD